MPIGYFLVTWLLGAIMAASPAAARTLKVVALGDSLTAGFQLPASAAFPTVLEKALKARGLDVTIANAGVSGDTSSGGLARLDWSVPDGTDAVILELGANDALRGLDPAITEKTLDAIIARLKDRKIAVLLAGMRAPPNLGREYREKFDGLYARLAARHGLVLYPFFLDGVAAEPKLNMADGIHPTAEGVARIVERMLPTVEQFLRRLPGSA